MGIEIRLPNITGYTEKEQLAQIKSYLYQLVQQLQFTLDSLGNSSGAVVDNAVSNTDVITEFNNLKPYIIRSQDIIDVYYTKISLRLEKDYNLERINTISVTADKFEIKSMFSEFSGEGTGRQTFFIFGNANATIVQGVAKIADNGTTQWEGTNGVTLQTKPEGMLTVVLPDIANDTFTVISGNDFSLGG